MHVVQFGVHLLQHHRSVPQRDRCSECTMGQRGPWSREPLLQSTPAQTHKAPSPALLGAICWWLPAPRKAALLVSAPASFTGLKLNSSLCLQGGCFWTLLNVFTSLSPRILALEKLGAVFNQVAFPLQYTPRKFVIHPESNNLIIIETDHNAYTEATKAQRKQQMAEVMGMGDRYAGLFSRGNPQLLTGSWLPFPGGFRALNAGTEMGENLPHHVNFRRMQYFWCSFLWVLLQQVLKSCLSGIGPACVTPSPGFSLTVWGCLDFTGLLSSVCSILFPEFLLWRNRLSRWLPRGQRRADSALQCSELQRFAGGMEALWFLCLPKPYSGIPALKAERWHVWEGNATSCFFTPVL